MVRRTTFVLVVAAAACQPERPCGLTICDIRDPDCQQRIGGAAACLRGSPELTVPMKVVSGDLIHADQHGAIVVPLDILDKLPAALADINAREARIIKAAKEVGTVEAIKAAMKG